MKHGRGIIEEGDLIWHTMTIGGTGSGKTNCMLYWLRRLYERGDVALILLDPAGDPSIELMRSLEDWNRITLFDPASVTFGLNPLALPEGITQQERVNVMQTQVEELSLILSDVFNTETANAPRLMWILKGALYYLYTFTDTPTFYALYSLLTDFMKKKMMVPGVSFTAPVFVYALIRLRVLEPEFFSKNRVIIWFAIWVVTGLFLTPDGGSLLDLVIFVPIVILVEAAVFLARHNLGEQARFHRMCLWLIDGQDW